MMPGLGVKAFVAAAVNQLWEIERLMYHISTEETVMIVITARL